MCVENYFVYHNKKYYRKTVVKIHDGECHNFGFYTTMIFNGYDIERNLYCFVSPCNSWDKYYMTDCQITACIKEIIQPCCDPCLQNEREKVDLKYVDGMLAAWIWYILIMCFGLFLNGIVNVLIVWTVASVIFFSWRKKKMNGG